MNLCECGCGQECKSRFVHNHHMVGRKRKHSDETRKKISQSLKGKPAWNKGLPGNFLGRKHTEETKRKISKNKNPNYVEKRSDGYCSAFHDRDYRQEIMKECCEICERQEKLLLHHLDNNKLNSHPDNLQTLCRSCHSRITNKGVVRSNDYREKMSKIKKEWWSDRKRKVV